MSANLSAILYLVSGVLFILALRGLSSPETSRQGNLFGIIGMVIAVTVTFLSVGNFSSGFVYVLIFLAIGLSPFNKAFIHLFPLMQFRAGVPSRLKIFKSFREVSSSLYISNWSNLRSLSWLSFSKEHFVIFSSLVMIKELPLQCIFTNSII